MTYELVVGLETHVELCTKSKIFCSCSTEFGGEANTHCCPICIGMPGALPKLNQAVVEYAIMAGLATHCDINRVSRMDRKNYVYPDLPKAYQISQYALPLCRDGYIELSSGHRVRIARIHIEEDAGKLLHRRGRTLIDYNRSGVPLIEIVTEPDIRSADEVKEYVEKLQLIMRTIGVSDCRMQEGSMRCDVNVSIRPEGSKEFGIRTEIKNMNSVSFMVKAVEYERKRQVDLLEDGGSIIQETRRYDESTRTTQEMRGKEDANDYRYFREPDLSTIHVTEEQLEDIKGRLPELPDKKLERYVEKYGIPQKDAELLVKYRKVSEFFEASIQNIECARVVSNLIIGEVFRIFQSEQEKEDFHVLVQPDEMGKIAQLINDGILKVHMAKRLLSNMLKTGESIDSLLQTMDVDGTDEQQLRELCEEAINANQKAAEDYKKGKEKALQSLIGYVMRSTKGQADVESTKRILLGILKKENNRLS